MTSLISSNLFRTERVARYFVGMLLIASVMIQIPGVPVWVSLLALYPISTAIMAWDPLYAGIQAFRRGMRFSVVWHHKGSAQSAL